MKLRTISLALLASAFMTSAALAQSGTMQPIPNPPEKHKVKAKRHAKKPKATAEAAKATEAKPEAKGKEAAKAAEAKPAAPATPPKK